MSMALLCGALALVLPVLALGGCSSRRAEAADAPVGEVSIRQAVTEADPQGAVDAVYAALPDAWPTPVSATEFERHFADVADKVESYYGCTSDPGGGLSDLLILKPRSGERDLVREALHLYQEKRVREFENYDILDSYTIARDAQVYDQGDYLILVMFGDNAAVQEIIDGYIPI